MLGSHGLALGEWMAMRGVIHAIEVHNKTLSDDGVLDVVSHLASAASPNTPNYRPTYEECPIVYHRAIIFRLP